MRASLSSAGLSRASSAHVVRTADAWEELSVSRVRKARTAAMRAGEIVSAARFKFVPTVRFDM